MIQIRPISDLRNKFTDVECAVKNGSPVFLTKNGYGAMVVMSIDHYELLTGQVEYRLDEADAAAAQSGERLSHEAVFASARGAVDGD